MSGQGLDLAMLAEMPRSDLVELWQKNIGSEPPKGISIRLLVGAIAYRQQAKAQGGLSPALSRTLKKLAAAEQAGQSVTAKAMRPARSLANGARLVREWNGVSHSVEVTADGYVWNGNHYRSLSAVARAITGARWSGPRFFGLGA